MTSIEHLILVCPDALKETATAAAAADALAAGVARARPGASIRTLPLADGGEGTLDVLASAFPGLEIRTVEAPGPRPDRPPVRARFGLHRARRLAVIELAEVAGLGLLEPVDRDPMRCGTEGVGRVLEAARTALHDVDGTSPMELILALGGSATVDGGIGVLRALGVEITGPPGPEGRPLVGADLARITDVRVPPEVRNRWGCVRWRLLADVRQPLVGEEGAAVVFGPQKGASPEAVTALDRGLAGWGRLLSTRYGADPAAIGSGAAGGIGFGLAAAFNARIEGGFPAVADLVGLEASIADSGLVVTSEGRLDDQSGMGKVVGEVLSLAEKHEVPVVVVPGAVDSRMAPRLLARFAAVRSLEDQVGPLRARSETPVALAETAAALLESIRV